MFEAIPKVDSQTAHENMPDYVPGSIMALLVGALNTEAKCITFASIPDIADLTPVANVRANLAKQGAYNLVDQKSYNVQGIVREMDALLVNVVDDPERDPVHGSMWVQKREAIGPFATGLAGSLLDVSLTHNTPLRRILGEQRTVGDISSIEIRLSTLCACAGLAIAGEPVDSLAVAHDVATQQGIRRATPERHINKLVAGGILANNSRNKDIVEFRNLPDGRDTLEITMALLSSIGRLAALPYAEAERGRRLAKEIATNERIVPALIKRSYASTTHTGKSTARKHHR